MGLGLALAATFTATQGLKDLIGKPRPDLIGRCDPDLSKISTYAVGGLGAMVQGAPTFVTYGICRNQGSDLKNDGFAAWPSGHSSCTSFTTLFNVEFYANESSFVRGYGILDTLAMREILGCVSVHRSLGLRREGTCSSNSSPKDRK